MESYDSTMRFCAHRELSTTRRNLLLYESNHALESLIKHLLSGMVVPLS